MTTFPFLLLRGYFLYALTPKDGPLVGEGGEDGLKGGEYGAERQADQHQEEEQGPDH